MNNTTVIDTVKLYLTESVKWIDVSMMLVFSSNNVLVLLLALAVFLPKRKAVKQIYSDIENVTQYPQVAVQLPMRNERLCVEAIIDHSCNLKWPQSRLTIFVLDDSDNKDVMELINARVDYWTSRGVSIKINRRGNTIGYKGGNLREGFKLIDNADFVVILDADFLPESDFLLKTVPHLQAHPNVAFVQTRWTFTNADANFLTKMQEIWLNFHFLCEQEGKYRVHIFFQFNGSATVWRKTAIEDSGGWDIDTVTEDMDIAIRAYIRGWEFLYLKNVTCPGEIPPTVDAYQKQQHRWYAGPMQVARKTIGPLLGSKKITCFQKLFVLVTLARCGPIGILALVFMLILAPLSAFLGIGGTFFTVLAVLQVVVTVTQVLFTPRKIHLAMLYLLFENAISIDRGLASIAGLLNLKSSRTWHVTPKFASNVPTSAVIVRSQPNPVKLLLQVRKGHLLVIASLAYCSYATIMADYYVAGGYCLSNAVMSFLFAINYFGERPSALKLCKDILCSSCTNRKTNSQVPDVENNL